MKKDFWVVRALVFSFSEDLLVALARVAVLDGFVVEVSQLFSHGRSLDDSALPDDFEVLLATNHIPC